MAMGPKDSWQPKSARTKITDQYIAGQSMRIGRDVGEVRLCRLCLSSMSANLSVMTKFLRLVALLFLAMLAACEQSDSWRFWNSADGPSGDSAPTQSRDSLRIVTAQGEHVFRIEMADNPSERSQGLMYRRELAPDAGMLFDFDEQRPVAMWMKNTYIPLDMLFIRRNGTIVTIAENTVPFSLQSIPSGEPVSGVLEVNGGTVRRLGIRPGDRVYHEMFAR